MGVKKVSMNGKGSYAAYKACSSFTKNKRRKIERHLKLQPNDAKAVEALKVVSSAKPRTTPKRMKARLDSWVLPNDKGDFIHNRSQNRLNGRLSPLGKFRQEAAAFSKANANRLLNDPRKVLYLHNLAPMSLNEVWDGWAAFEANGGKVVHERKPNQNKHKNKKHAKKSA